MFVFIQPLVTLALALLRTAMFWKTGAFIAILIGAGTDAGKAVFMWLMNIIMGLVLSLMNSMLPDFPQTVPELVNSLPLQVLQTLNLLRLPLIAQIISSALIIRLVLSFIPFRKG